MAAALVDQTGAVILGAQARVGRDTKAGREDTQDIPAVAQAAAAGLLREGTRLHLRQPPAAMATRPQSPVHLWSIVAVVVEDRGLEPAQTGAQAAVVKAATRTLRTHKTERITLAAAVADQDAVQAERRDTQAQAAKES